MALYLVESLFCKKYLDIMDKMVYQWNSFMDTPLSSTSWLLPREHGAWGIVLIPYLTAVVIAGYWTPAVVVGLGAVLAAFIARYPVELLFNQGLYRRAGSPPRSRVKKFACGYATVASALGVGLISGWKLYLLLPIGLLALLLLAVHLRLGHEGEDRSWGAELLGTAGLTLSGLAGWVVATGSLDATGALVWLLNCVFFCAGVVYVKARIRHRLAVHRPELRGTTRWMIACHAVMVIFVASLLIARWIPPLVAVPFALAAARAGWGAAQGERPFALRRLGWSEVALSVFFALFLTLGFRLAS